MIEGKYKTILDVYVNVNNYVGVWASGVANGLLAGKETTGSSKFVKLICERIYGYDFD